MHRKSTENADFTLSAHLSGTVVPIEDVEDDVFSGEILGDGIAVEPSVCNSDDYSDISDVASGNITAGNDILKIN